MAAEIRVVMLDLMAIVPYYTTHLCASLAEAGGIGLRLASATYQHDPDCFRRRGLDNRPGLLDLAFRLRRLPAVVRRSLKVAEYLANMFTLLVQFAVSRPDVVHAQFLPLTRYRLPVERWFLRVIRALGIRVVYTVHNVLPQGSGNRCTDAYQSLYRQADRLICHDAAAAGRLRTEFLIAPGRIAVIPHGEFFEEAGSSHAASVRAKLGFTSDECFVLWQGIVEPYKGISFLLEAWRRVRDAGGRGRLAVVGTGRAGLLSAIRQQVAALGLQSSVRLVLRFVSVQELAEFYEAADILVYPYSEITTSGALMTGIGRGKAIVATALPAFERILQHGQTALLVPYGDVEALATSLVRLIRDPSLRYALGENLRASQARVPKWPQIAAETRACYRAALGEHSGWRRQPANT